jgi:glucose-6-phosphate dehydrogenase assembly protein OpcA
VTADLGNPPAPIETSRWQARATSISQTVAELSRIWTIAAEETERAEPTRSQRARAMGDPRLGPRLDHERDVRVRTRTSVLTLVVVADRPETTERALAVINALASRHPSRAIILSPGDPDGPATVESHIFAACRLAASGGAEVCTEEILVRTGGELSEHLSTVVAPLLIHDLPVVLWWPGDPPFGTKRFTGLTEQSDTLLVDSGTFRDDGRRGLHGIAATIGAGRSVHDIGWIRLSLWRELLAGLFDHPLLTGELGSAHHLRLDVAQPGSVFRVSKAVAYAGWLAGMLGWEVHKPLEVSVQGQRMQGSFVHKRKAVTVEIRAIRAGLASSIQGAGSLVRVELELSRGKATTRARVTRQADHLLATAEWNGAQVSRRAGRLEPFEETPFLAEALDNTARDRVFELALDRACSFAGA